MRQAVRILGRLMIVTGILALVAVVGWQWLGNTSAQRAQQKTVQSLEHQFSSGAPERSPASSAPSRGPARLAGDDSDAATVGSNRTQGLAFDAADGKPFALIRIPRFGADFVRPIVQGTGTVQLQEGVGHYLGTAGPGQPGNFALAGHRTTFGEPFHLIATLRPGDRIIVQTDEHTYTYRVIDHVVVDPSDVQVIAPDPPGVEPGYLLTMTSCHPMYLALQRYVVHARLVSTSPGPRPASVS